MKLSQIAGTKGAWQGSAMWDPGLDPRTEKGQQCGRW